MIRKKKVYEYTDKEISKGFESWEEYALRLEGIIAQLQRELSELTSYTEGLCEGIELREKKAMAENDSD